MAMRFDQQTLERFRRMTPEQAIQAATDAVYGSGAVGSEDFLDVYEQLVDAGIIDWDQVEDPCARG